MTPPGRGSEKGGKASHCVRPSQMRMRSPQLRSANRSLARWEISLRITNGPNTLLSLPGIGIDLDVGAAILFPAFRRGVGIDRPIRAVPGSPHSVFGEPGLVDEVALHGFSALLRELHIV